MATYGPVEFAVRAELRVMGVSMRASILAATMVSLARQIDGSRGATAAAAAALQLRETRAAMIEERDRQPSGDVVDELNAGSAERRDGSAAAAVVVGSGLRSVGGGAGRPHR